MKLLKKAIITAATISTFSTASLSAHSLWVNSFESFSHKPGHTTVGLGWGHSIPIDDILNSQNGKIIVESFNIVSPKGKITKLKIPSSEKPISLGKTKNFDIYEADIGLQKISLNSNSEKGVYEIKASSKPTMYTQYIDNNDKTRLKLTSMDKIKNIKKILMSVKFQANAKSYLTIGKKWTQPKANNKGLEIIPLTDLSNVKIGDLIKFKVLYFGNPLTVSAKSMEFITAQSNTFGQNDGFSLFSYLQNGEAQFRVQTSGQWIVSCSHKQDVTKDGPLNKLIGKINQVYHGSSVTFNVK